MTVDENGNPVISQADIPALRIFRERWIKAERSDLLKIVAEEINSELGVNGKGLWQKIACRIEA